MSLISKNKIKILTDFKSNLEMFNLTRENLGIISKRFKKDISIEFFRFDKN